MTNNDVLALIKGAQQQIADQQQFFNDAQAKLADLQTAMRQASMLGTIVTDLNTAVASLTPPPPPPPAAQVNPLLAAVQKQFGQNKVGVYTGVWTVNDAAAQFSQIALRLKQMNVDFALVKMGEGAFIWHGGDFASIDAAFAQYGLGCGAYWYCRPEGGQQQITYCAQLAKRFGLIVLDAEDEYAHQDIAFQQLLAGIKQAAPDACVIVSGYGDPVARFGPANYDRVNHPEAGGWPFHTLETAGVVYQPQAYFGVWNAYLNGSVKAALQWCVSQCAQAFGPSIVLQPAINVQGIKSLADFEAAAAFWKPFGASVVVWEYQQITADIIAAVRKGLQS